MNEDDNPNTVTVNAGRVRDEILDLLEVLRRYRVLEGQELTEAQVNSIKLAIAEREAQLDALPKDPDQ